MMTQETAASSMVGCRGARGLFKNLLYWVLDWDDEITLAQGRERMRNSPGLIASLTPEQLEMIRNYDGPENLGPQFTEHQLRRIVERLAKR
jgi:hypothetical protein